MVGALQRPGCCQHRARIRHLPRQVAGRPARALPVACQRGAAVGAPPLRNQKFADSPLEGKGFELAVPREVAFVSLRQPDASQGGSVSKVQPTGVKQLASSSDISTMRSSPIVICRPEKVWTAPIPGGALTRT